MQNYTPPDGWGPLLHFLQQNRLAIQGAITAFCIALLFSLRDGSGWRRSFNAGFICGFIALGVSSLLEQLGRQISTGRLLWVLLWGLLARIAAVRLLMQPLV